MISTTSLRSRGSEWKQVYVWTLKKNRGMLFLLTALMFVALPVITMCALYRWSFSGPQGNAESVQELSGDLIHLLQIVIPVLIVPLVLLFALILCITLFGYMQKKRSVDLFHALPVGRVPMLLGRWCAGLTILYVPLLINFLILGIVAQSYGVLSALSAGVPEFLWVLLMGTASFTFSVLIAVCSGTTFDTLISIVGINIGYPLFVLCIFSYIQSILPGFYTNLGDNLTVITLLAPYVAAFLPFFQKDSTFYLVWWILLTVFMLVGSVWLYQKRRSETAEDTFAFPVPKIVIRFLVTAVGGLGLGALMDPAGGVLFFVGVFIGSVLTHGVVEALYSRGFRNMKKSVGWYGAFAAFFLVFYGILSTGCFGYDTRVPREDDVASVVVETGYGDFSQPGCSEVFDQNRQPIAQIQPVLTESADIRTVIGVQKKIVDLYREEGYPYRMKDCCGFGTTITYRLKNGMTFQRKYVLYNLQANSDYTSSMKTLVKKIVTLPSYLSGRDAIFYVDPGDISSMTYQFPADEETGQVTAVIGETEKEELFSALKQDFIGNKINAYFSESEKNELVRFNIKFRKNIAVKNNRLKVLVGGYQGKINLAEGSYSIYDKNSSAYRVLKKWQGK